MKVTLKDIARLSNVSIATVSKIVNNKDAHISDATRNRVNKFIDEQNYVPNRVASSMITKKSNSIGLVIPDIANPFYPDLARGVEDCASECGYDVILCNTDNHSKKEEDYFRVLQEKMVDGVVYVSASEKSDLVTNSVKLPFPVVTLDRETSPYVFNGTVTVDNKSSAHDAVAYLLNQGYERIIHITGPLTLMPTKERKKGYTKALKDYNNDFNQIFVGNFTTEWGYECISKLLNNNLKFDAVFCGNDLIAIGALKALGEYKFDIPSDVGVIGFDDINMCAFVSPGITTVKQPKYMMGYTATRMLIDFIEGKKVNNNNVILETELIIRGSSK